MISRQTGLVCWAETSKFERHIQLVSEQLKIACCQFYCLLLVCLGDPFPFALQLEVLIIYFPLNIFTSMTKYFLMCYHLLYFYPMASFSCAYGALVYV